MTARNSDHRTYRDIRDLHAEFERRECPCCGLQWYYKNGMANGTYCPECESRPLFWKLAEKYAAHYAEYDRDEYNIAPPPYHRYIPKAMAYEASEELGFPVNEYRCLRFIDASLSESHRRHKDEVPWTHKPREDAIITDPREYTEC